MTYLDLANLAVDEDFSRRLAACAAEQEVAGSNLGAHPVSWAAAQQWRLAASPGFADAYAYAVSTGVESPGADPSVITDAQILAAVQAVLSEGATP